MVTAYRSPDRADRDSGFTLIELLVVVVIIGILIAIAIPLYLNYQQGSYNKAAQSDVRGAIGILESCNNDNAGYPTSLGTATGNRYTAMTGCANQSIVFSANTTLTYTPSGTASYVLTGKNPSGSKTFCYNSTQGGSVLALTGSATTC